MSTTHLCRLLSNLSFLRKSSLTFLLELICLLEMHIEFNLYNFSGTDVVVLFCDFSRQREVILKELSQQDS